MRNYKLYMLQLLMCLLPISVSANNIYSFESSIPSGFSATNGNLSLSDTKYKLGSQSMRWDWSANSVLSIANPLNLTTSATNNSGGINVWIYNLKENSEPLKIAFYDAAGTEQCYINFKLNFSGWRCLTAIFRYDMGFKKEQATLNSAKLLAPSSGNGTFYLDFLEFNDNISWERISDFQYNLNQTNHNIISFLAIRNASEFPPINPNAAERDALETISQRLDNWYLGTNKHAGNSIYKERVKALNTYVNSAKNKINLLNLTKDSDGVVTGTGLFPVTYQGARVDGVSINTFRNVSETFLIQLAYDYRRTNNATSLATAQDIYSWFNDQGWADGSALGSLRFEMLRSAGFYHSAWMLKDEFSPAQFNQIMDAMRWHSLFGKSYEIPETPGELSDYIRTLAVPKLIYALTIKDEAKRNTAMHAFQTYIKNALDKAPGFKGTMKPDYSGYHHNGPYYSAYYPDALYTGALIYYLLRDTPYDLGEETFQNLKQALLTFRFFSGEFNVPGAITGRFPSQQTIVHQLLPAFAYLGSSKETPDVELLSAFKRLWKPTQNPMWSYIQKVRTDICFSSSLGEVELLLDFDAQNGVAEANPEGTLYMPYSGLMVARQANWMLTAKGMSKYIWDYESSGTENVYGRYLSYGHLEYTDLENGNSSYNPSKTDWNWNHIPGTTSKSLSYTNLDYNKTNGKHRNLSDNTFLGGISLNDRCAMFTNQVHDNAIDNSFYADKSVFVFGNFAYCIGSGINSRSTSTPVYTTLFQNVLSAGFEDVYINDEKYTSDVLDIENPTIRDNYGNVFVVENGLAQVKRNSNMMLAYLDHGRVIANKQYAYAWFIKPTEGQVAKYKSESPITILAQNATAHAVYNKDEKILALSAFITENALDIREIHSLSKPMLVMLQEEDRQTVNLLFSDPDMKRDSAPRGDDVTPNVAQQKGEVTEVSITLNGNYTKAEGDANIKVEVNGDKTIVSYPFAKEGETYSVKLTNASISIDNEEVDSPKFFVRTDGESIILETDMAEAFDCRVFDLLGTQVFQQSDNLGAVRVPKSAIASKLILINVSNSRLSKKIKYINNQN